MSPGLRRLLLRLPLLLVLAVAAWFFLGDRPRRVDLVYDLDGENPPAHVDVRILAPDGRTEAELSWGWGGKAQDPMPHHPLLAPGDHRLQARLTYPDGRVVDVERDLPTSGDAPDDTGTAVVHLP